MQDFGGIAPAGVAGNKLYCHSGGTCRQDKSLVADQIAYVLLIRIRVALDDPNREIFLAEGATQRIHLDRDRAKACLARTQSERIKNFDFQLGTAGRLSGGERNWRSNSGQAGYPQPAADQGAEGPAERSTPASRRNRWEQAIQI